MNLTETEAKTKWCPFSRTGAYTDIGNTIAITTNRDPRPDVQSSCNCIASECMMWKWEKDYVNRGRCGLMR